MTLPSQDDLFAALDATWPAARFIPAGPWQLREGRGGGQRVSAATAEAAFVEKDVDDAESKMRDLGQTPLFMVRGEDTTLDAMLGNRGFEIVDPVTLYLAPTDSLTAKLPLTAAMPSWPPLAVQLEIWARSGIGPARIAVMERAKGPKTAMLGRSGDTPSGTAFVASHNGIAMIHAIEVAPECRRQGVGRNLMQGCANWAKSVGADWVTLAVTRANSGANALYADLGMEPVTQYHYRRLTGDKP